MNIIIVLTINTSMLINDVIFLLEKLNDKGKYITLDDTVYRAMGISELTSILTKKGFEPDISKEGMPWKKRADSIEYDTWSEENQIADDSANFYNDAYIKRKMKINDKFKYPKKSADPIGDDLKSKSEKAKREKLRQKYKKIHGIDDTKSENELPEHVGFFKSFSRSLNDSLSLNFNLKDDKLTVEFYREPLKNLQGAKLVPFGWMKNYYDNRVDDSKPYISSKNELEDRLYYNTNFVPFKGPLNKYIKRIYVDMGQFKADKRQRVLDILNIAAKEGIEIRQYDKTKPMMHHLDKVKPDPITGKKVPPTLETHPEFFTPNELRRGPSTDWDAAYSKLKPKPDKKADPKKYEKWKNRKKKRAALRKKIEDQNPLEYFKAAKH